MMVVPIAAAAMAVLTWLIGWWAVPLVAAFVGSVLYLRAGIAWRMALAAAIAWALLLLVDATTGRLGVAATTLGGVLRVPGVVLVLITLAFPALLAWSAATVAIAVRRLEAARRRIREKR
ncbi:MAG TPA: hypothetical protein VFI52_12040 [Gemmatimonadaceae bacterium]|nr:hypothetical protein [Gemmatimonadaceae bacterium]